MTLPTDVANTETAGIPQKPVQSQQVSAADPQQHQGSSHDI